MARVMIGSVQGLVFGPVMSVDAAVASRLELPDLLKRDQPFKIRKSVRTVLTCHSNSSSLPPGIHLTAALCTKLSFRRRENHRPWDAPRTFAGPSFAPMGGPIAQAMSDFD
jgi:hypothetical protein